MVLKAFLLILFLIIMPMVLGLPWIQCVPGARRRSLVACFPLGYYIELALFHFLAVPFAFLKWPFTVLSVLFICVVVIVGIVSVVFVIRNKDLSFNLPKFSAWEYAYLVVFYILLGLQIYNGIALDTTGKSYDDAIYVTYGADAVRYDRMLTIDPNTGLAAQPDVLRALQSSLFFPAFLTQISGIPVTVMNRTILEAFYIMLAYSVYVYMAAVVFKKKENGLIFLIFLSVLHIFGYYSQYSITFRLLGPSYQGKAILAAGLLPLLLTFLIQKMEEEYDIKTGVLLLLLSTAATALTMFGAVTFVLNLLLVVLLSLFRKRRNWRHLLYLVWGSMIPVLYGGVYFIYINFRW